MYQAQRKDLVIGKDLLHYSTNFLTPSITTLLTTSPSLLASPFVSFFPKLPPSLPYVPSDPSALSSLLAALLKPTPSASMKIRRHSLHTTHQKKKRLHATHA
jgi:hypothetical protein